MRLIVNEEQGGQRLDVVTANVLPSVSRAYVHKLIEEGKITIAASATKPGYRVRLGDSIQIDYDPAIATVIPTIDVPVLYEDSNCIVLNKPAGLLTHALGKHGDEPSVASFIRSKIKDMTGDRAGVVHRLDRATSGVIIGAKNQTTMSFLQKQFSDRKVKKTYMAIVDGELSQPEAIIDMPIERNPKAPSTFRVGSNGKTAQTHYKTLQTGPKRSLLELKPATGRTHQLRVHLAKAGHPIVGDPLYGKGKYGDRLMLHALSLEITLPGGDRKIFTAPLPADFQEMLDAE